MNYAVGDSQWRVNPQLQIWHQREENNASSLSESATKTSCMVIHDSVDYCAGTLYGLANLKKYLFVVYGVRLAFSRHLGGTQ